MTKRDFELIANSINNVRCRAYEHGETNTGGLSALQELTDRLVLNFQAENPRFKEETFKKACGF